MPKRIIPVSYVTLAVSSDSGGPPPMSFDLIKELDIAYPPLCILPGQSVEEAHRYAGKREMVDELLAWFASDKEAE